ATGNPYRLWTWLAQHVGRTLANANAPEGAACAGQTNEKKRRRTSRTVNVDDLAHDGKEAGSARQHRRGSGSLSLTRRTQETDGKRLFPNRLLTGLRRWVE